jgi:hypothetical protein
MPLPEAAVEQCRAWLDWAAAQIDACLASDTEASGQLLVSLDELMGAARPQAGAAIDANMAAVVVAVQSHDRLMQRLTHVVESLRVLHDHLGDVSRAESPDEWRVLREKQWRSFSMPEERALFCSMVAEAGDECNSARVVHAPDGIELFDAEDDCGGAAP